MFSIITAYLTFIFCPTGQLASIPSLQYVLACWRTINQAHNKTPRSFRLDWGADDTLASWVVDESWTATGNLQADSRYAITATFSDDNGAVVLGRAHLTFTTSTDLTQSFEVTASEFDTESVDDDVDLNRSKVI